MRDLIDITLHIMIKPATHPLPGLKGACRIAKGDIIDVYKATKYATLQEDGNYMLDKPPGHERFGFVHIKNVPNTPSIRNKLISGIDIAGESVRQCKWHIPPSMLPNVLKQKLLLEKQITVEWEVAKPYIRKKTVPVILDPSQDDISTSLTDGDIS